MENDTENSAEAHVQQQQQEHGDLEEMSLRPAFKEEFRLKNFGLTFHRDDVFYRAQWEWPSVIHLTYRVFLAAYTATWMVVSIGGGPVVFGHPWITFLTNWSYLLLVIHLWLAAIIALFWTSNIPFLARPTPFTEPPPRSRPMSRSGRSGSYGSDDNEAVIPEVTVQTPSRLPVLFRLSWAVFAAIGNVVFIITFIYFVFLMPRVYKNGGHPGPVDINIHGINSVIVVIEMCVSAYPVRILHAIYPIIYGISYILFSVFYWAADHEHNVIYKNILDWNKPGQTVVIIIALFVVAQIIQVVLWLMYRLRLWVYKKIYAGDNIFE